MEKQKEIVVLYVTHYADMYGANISLLNLIVDLRDRYNVCPIVVGPKLGEFSEKLKEEEISYYVVHYLKWMYDGHKHTKGYLMLIRALRRFYNLKAVDKISKICREKEVQLVHTNSSVTEVGLLVAKKKHIPHIWHIREFGKEDYNLDYVCGKKYIRKCYESSQAIIAISYSIKEHIQKLAETSNVITIYNGVKICQGYEKVYFDTNNKVRFCCAGNITIEKNQIVIIMAVDRIVKDGYRDFQVSIIGSGQTEYIQYLENKIHELKIEQYIHLLPYTTQMDKVLKEMDIGIVPSVKEAFGRITVEYMSNYMPVIGSDSGGTKELIDNKVNGFTFSSNVPEDLAAKMKYYMERPAEVKQQGNKARLLAEQIYEMKINTDKIVNLYRSKIYE